MRTGTLTAALAAALIAAPACAQTPALPEDDCAFLELSFQQVYDGMRDRGASMREADPQLVTMFVLIQSNIIQMHTALDCDAGKLVDLARQEAAKYMSGPPAQ